MDAIRLFEDRAGLSQPGFRVTAENAQTVAAICALVEGLPLALEMTAARMKILDLEQIHDRMQNYFQLLDHNTNDPAHHHVTLRASLDWSYALLNQKEALLLQRLAVFSNGSELAGVESVCSGEGIETGEILDLLESLFEKSLIYTRKGAAGGFRYLMLQLV